MHVETGARKAARDDVEEALERRRDGFGDAVTQRAAHVVGCDVGLDRVLAEIQIVAAQVENESKV